MAEVEVLQLLVSPAHRLAGRPSEGPSPGPSDERVTRVEVRASWDWSATATTPGPPIGTRR
ncbi:hypothetical protein [Streptomyces hawaiiensis]|uniref:hypothetical protein n=1 Tax=Streptomyces hawaiiensis TaxID=67305 RepID=UPI00365F6ABB